MKKESSFNKSYVDSLAVYKKLLLALLFTNFTITLILTLVLFFWGNSYFNWEVNKKNLTGFIFCFILNILFCWGFLANFFEIFFPKVKWYQVLGGYLFLPLAIPYLKVKKEVINYSLFDQTNNKQRNKNLFILTNIVNALFFSWAFFWYYTLILMLSFWMTWLLLVSMPMLLAFVAWLVGWYFFNLNYFRPNKKYEKFAWLGLYVNWVYLVWNSQQHTNIIEAGIES